MCSRLSAVSWTAPFVLVWLTGCQPARSSVRVSVDDYNTRPGFSQARNEPFSGIERAAVVLSASINEVVSFTFALAPNQDPVARVGLRITPLVSDQATVDPTVLTIYRMHRVPVRRWRGWHIRAIPPDQRVDKPYDVLVPWRAPRGGLPGILLPGQDYRFWVDVTVPKGTAPGTYRGAVSVTAGDRDVGGVDVTLTVSSVVLPDERSIPVIAPVDYRSLIRHHIRRLGQPYVPARDDWRSDPAGGEIDALLGDTMRLLRAHRLTPVLPDLAPIARISARGALQLDWSAYDAIVEPFLDGRAFADRVPLEAWPIPVRGLNPGVGVRGLGNRRDDAFTRYVLAGCAQHFRAKGWLERAYASADSPGVSVVDGLTDVKRFGRIARRADPSLPVLTHMFPQDLAPYGWPGFPRVDLSGVVDIWAPPAQFYDEAALRTESGRRWMSVDRPPFSGTLELGAPPGCVLGLPWQARRLGAGAIVVTSVNHWPDATGVDPSSCLAFDTRSLLYPGEAFGLSRPIPSVRLKLLRRAMYDAAYRDLLDAQGEEHISAVLEESLVSYVGADAYRAHFADGRPIGFALDAGAYEAARQIMADRLRPGTSKNIGGKAGSAVVRNATWRRFMLNRRRVEFLVDGCRVRGAFSPERDGLDVDCWVSIINRTRVPVEGQWRWDRLADGWTTTARAWTVPPVAPNDVRRFLLSATARTFDTGDGHVSQSAVLATKDGTVRRVPLRVSLVTAERVERPIVVDGDLSDWRAARTNVASGFRLISATPLSESAGAAVFPLLRTVAFLARDDQALYLGLNAVLRDNEPSAPMRRNTVHYDDMIPVGDELIELLFDPLNAGTRSPSDLYHIAIKPAGTYLAERGIAFDPPCGAREPWSADVEVASRVEGDRWTAELRIPLEAFGDQFETEGAIWGFNVTRYDAAGQQFSTWSGASGNAYDPLSLGNLYLPGGAGQARAR